MGPGKYYLKSMINFTVNKFLMTTAEKLHKDSVTTSACIVLRKVVQITYCGFKTVVHVRHKRFAKNNLIKKFFFKN